MDEVNASPTTETGGIVIGRITGSTATVEIATGPGPNAVRTATRFERDVEYAQNQLELAISRDTSLAYVGEWHSHLVATPEPSGRDVLSMTGIAGSSNYATDCPTMLICGFDTAKNEIGELKAWVFPVASCMRQVSIVQRTVA
jgi:integrative and conjugative element protein (TIGR02256 family)